MGRPGVRINILSLIIIGLSLVGCKSDPKDTSKLDEPLEVVNKLRIPPFNADSAYTYVEDQVNMGPRVPGSKAHAEAITYFKRMFTQFGTKVKLQPMTKRRYDGVEMKGTNIIASVHPEIKQRIFLCAHWDSRFIAEKDADKSKRDIPILGADDGASGVGVIMEIARQIQGTPLERVGIDFVLFDLEDQGDNGDGIRNTANTWGIGAQYWSANLPKGYRPEFGILLDMVGSTNARFDKEGHSYQNAKDVVNKVWNIGRGIGYGQHFVNEVGRGTIDDHYFITKNSGIPCIDIINRKPSGNFGDYHHTHNDDMSVIDKNTLKAVGQTVLASVYHYHNGTF